jgi:hypothetical protein
LTASTRAEVIVAAEQRVKALRDRLLDGELLGQGREKV